MTDLNELASRIAADAPLSRGAVLAELKLMRAEGTPLPQWEEAAGLIDLARSQGLKASEWGQMWRAEMMTMHPEDEEWVDPNADTAVIPFEELPFEED